MDQANNQQYYQLPKPAQVSTNPWLVAANKLMEKKSSVVVTQPTITEPVSVELNLTTEPILIEKDKSYTAIATEPIFSIPEVVEVVNVVVQGVVSKPTVSEATEPIPEVTKIVSEEPVTFTITQLAPFTDNVDLSWKIIHLPEIPDARPMRSYSWAAKAPVPGLWTPKFIDVVPPRFTNIDNLGNIQVAWTMYTIWLQLKPRSQTVNVVNAQLEFTTWYEWLLLKKFNPSVTALLNWFSERETDPRTVYQICTIEELKRVLAYTGPVINTRGVILTTYETKKNVFKGYNCCMIEQTSFEPAEVLVPPKFETNYCYLSK